MGNKMICDICGREILEHWHFFVEEGYVDRNNIKQQIAVSLCEICSMKGADTYRYSPDDPNIP